LSIRLDTVARSDELAAALRGLAAFLAAGFLAAFGDLLDVFPTIVFHSMTEVT
jgi:hypothetical protein